MNETKPSEAQMLAAMVTGNATMEGAYAAIQKSHRFPFHIFAQIENLAEMGGVSQSLIINQLLTCGLESLKKELPKEAIKRIEFISEKQVSRPTKMLKETSRKPRKKTS